MVANDQVTRVQQLARERISQRCISRMVGISRDTVRRILTGQRQVQPRTLRLPLPNASRPPQRCPHCGARVYMPCLACGLRSLESARAG